MSEYPFCTELPENVWKTSEWYPLKLVSNRLNMLAKEGKKLPSNALVYKTVFEISKIIKENGGLSAKTTLNFEPLLKGLESE